MNSVLGPLLIALGLALLVAFLAGCASSRTLAGLCDVTETRTLMFVTVDIACWNLEVARR